MNLFRMFVVLIALFVGQARASDVDECTLRGEVAKKTIQERVSGVSLVTTKELFYTWLTPDYTNPQARLSGLTPAEGNRIINWYNSWGGELMELWFEYVYNKYDDAQLAFDQEYQACVDTNNAAPQSLK